jgi:hypothetical protein
MKKNTAEEQPVPTFESIRDELNAAGTDRGVAVLGGTLIERLLIEMLSKLLGVDGNTKKFFADSTSFTLRTIAYSTGIIPKELAEDIQKISSIRNDFAHDVTINSFDLARIKLAVRDLHASSIAINFSGPLPKGATAPVKTIKSFPVRVQFIYAVANVALLLEQITAETSAFAKSRWTYPTSPKVGKK